MEKQETKLTVIDKQIGQNVASLRRAAWMTQAELGEAMSTPVTMQAVCKWEKGQSRIFSSQLVEIAQALHCNVSELYAGVDGILRTGELPKRSRKGDKLLKDYAAINDPALQDVLSNLAHALAIETSIKLKEIHRHG